MAPQNLNPDLEPWGQTQTPQSSHPVPALGFDSSPKQTQHGKPLPLPPGQIQASTLFWAQTQAQGPQC